MYQSSAEVSVNEHPNTPYTIVDTQLTEGEDSCKHSGVTDRENVEDISVWYRGVGENNSDEQTSDDQLFQAFQANQRAGQGNHQELENNQGDD